MRLLIFGLIFLVFALGCTQQSERKGAISPEEFIPELSPPEEPLPEITQEVCDGIDNNNDGQVDEGFDQDSDGIVDCRDNCAPVFNPDQKDSDLDGVGDPCEATAPSEEVKTTEGITKTQCQVAGGNWNECGSACRGAGEGTGCETVCVAYCECGGIAGFACPKDYECTDYLPSKETPDAMGICKPIKK